MNNSTDQRIVSAVYEAKGMEIYPGQYGFPELLAEFETWCDAALRLTGSQLLAVSIRRSESGEIISITADVNGNGARAAS